MQELSGDIAVFKKYLKIKGVDTAAADELDKLYKTWKAMGRSRRYYLQTVRGGIE